MGVHILVIFCPCNIPLGDLETKKVQISNKVGSLLQLNLDSIFKSRDITLPTKVCLVKAMVFPVVMYGCESWTGKKAECQRIDAFELWCWRRLLRADRKSTRLNSSHPNPSRMPSSA